MASEPTAPQTLRLRDGVRLAYQDLGAGDPILLVHGWAASGDFFETLSGELSATHRVIIPDLRAHGVSEAGTVPLTIETLADDMAELIAALELDRVVILGWSMGALVLWRMMQRHGSAMIAGMIVEDMSPRVLNNSDWALGMSNGLDAQSSARAMRAMTSDWAAYARAFTPKIFSRERLYRDPDMIGHACERIQTLDPKAMADLWSSMTQQDLRAELPAMKVPTLVTYGERSDAYGPETSRYLVTTLPDASTKGFAHSGHAPHMEEPEEFARAVTDFARQVQPASNPKD